MDSSVKERPILFSSPMVRALLDGSKTQTRRAFSARMIKTMGHAAAAGEVSHFIEEGAMQPNDIGYVLDFCPYGQPGDRLWVRETWRSTGDGGRADHMPPRDMQPHPVWYDADGAAPADECTGKTRTSIHMPRWASRILLEIVSVRVERLNDCSDADALAEGVDRTNTSIPGYAKERYRHLWDSINGAGSWAANPWVWVIEFRRVTP